MFWSWTYIWHLQGVFALCRVVKKNDKTNDSNGEPKAPKRVGTSSSNVDLTSNEPLSISAGMSSQVNYESRHSSHTTSPYEATPTAEFEPASRDANPADFWVSPDLILDSSKVCDKS